MRSMDCPRISAAVNPNIRSAPLFQLTIRPCRSLPTTASSVEATIAARNERFSSARQVMDGAIRPNHPELGVKSGFFSERSLNSLRQGRAVLRVNQVREILERTAKDASFGAKRRSSFLVPRPV